MSRLRAARASDRRAAHPAVESAEGAGGDALERLLETERRLDAELAAARSEAAEVVERARADAERLAADGGSRLKQALAALHDEIAAARDDEIREIQERAQRQRVRYESVSGETLDELARWLAARVAGFPEPS